MIELWEAALTGVDTDGFYGVQRTGQGGTESGLTPDRLYHTFGFVSRPLDPTSAGACQLFYQRAGTGEGYSWLANDPRLVSKYPQTKKGGSCQYASDGSFASFDPETHTWTLYVPYADGKAHLVTVGKDGNGTPILESAHGNGQAVTMLDRSLVVKNCAGDGYIELNDSGCVINANLKLHGAAEINGAKITPTGDVVTSTGVSLTLHTHPTALGPSGPPIPTPGL
jgi:hypothetical protein